MTYISLVESDELNLKTAYSLSISNRRLLNSNEESVDWNTLDPSLAKNNEPVRVKDDWVSSNKIKL